MSENEGNARSLPPALAETAASGSRTEISKVSTIVLLATTSLPYNKAYIDSCFSQPAETTVGNHIKLLRQYNKMKDVGQQLIGLIAENRGVPVGSLYVNQDYGVGPDD